MATQLETVNNVLRRLREDTVSTINETVYSQLIAQFVNDAKADMEEIAYDWSAYITEIDTTVLADGTTTYDLTDTNDRSYMIRQQEDRTPMAFDITTNDRHQLYDIPYKELLETRAGAAAVDVAKPQIFSIISDSDGRGFSLELLYGADNARPWRTYWYVPQAELAIDDTDSSTEILLPARPIQLRAYYYASEDRGEAQGVALDLLWRRSENAIGAAIEIDQQVNKPYENNIRNDESL